MESDQGNFLDDETMYAIYNSLLYLPGSFTIVLSVRFLTDEYRKTPNQKRTLIDEMEGALKVD